jgi:hypothetical protein
MVDHGSGAGLEVVLPALAAERRTEDVQEVGELLRRVQEAEDGEEASRAGK